MTLTVRRYETRDVEEWDSLVAASWNGTFIHGRRFLSYHGQRFRDSSLVIEDDKGNMAGVFPAAVDPAQDDTIISHPGLTYGGVVHRGPLRGGAMLEALQAIAEAYRAAGFRRLIYKAVPHVYHKVPSADDLYALFRLDALRYRCDLSAAIDLASHVRLRKNRRNDLGNARRACVRIETGLSYLEAFWAVLEKNLRTKYDARPVHTLEEITRLHNMFPEQIECMVGKANDEVVAGVVLFRAERVTHLQYSSSTVSQFADSRARRVAASAHTAVLARAIEDSKDRGARYFDFGASNEREGRVLNQGLYQFKASFGAGGVVHEFYELRLDRGVDFTSHG
jgi:Acetyltransferase (GNAT) domain